jgi:hypothetical protein
MNKTKELTLRLKAYTKEGENIDTAKLLSVLMKKHGISNKDINGKIKQNEIVKFNPHYEFLSMMIIKSILGDVPLFKVYNEGKIVKDNCIISCSKSELLEILAKLDFYINAYATEVDCLKLAFILKNNILIKNYEVQSPDDVDLSKMEKVITFSKAIKKHLIAKPIKGTL